MKELYIKNNEYINKINKLNKELNETNLRYKDILNTLFPNVTPP